jgi:hypothetical protein
MAWLSGNPAEVSRVGIQLKTKTMINWLINAANESSTVSHENSRENNCRNRPSVAASDLGTT